MKKKVFITGGSTGIGRELVQLYLKEDWLVGTCGRSKDKLETGFDHENFSFYEVDVVDLKKLREAIKDFSKGQLDLLIANAGIALANKTKLPDFDLARKLIDVNVKGVINSFEVALDLMLPLKNGHIAAIASVSGFQGLPGAASYCASKAAVIQLCESFAIDLKPEGIDVTCICPGFIDTPLTRKNPHSMPFILKGSEGARRIKKALDRKKALYIFPWQMHIVIKILSRMPRSLYRFIMGFQAFNYSTKTK